MITTKNGNEVGFPAGALLDLFGSVVWDAFGEPPFLVGSACTSKAWRDVDVRLILRDEEFAAMFGSFPPPHGGKWAALCMAFSALGKQMTGLPVDFQIQQMTDANEKYDGPRHALGLIEARRA